MKFLVDADCPRAIGVALREWQYEVSDIRDTNPRAADEEIYEIIKKDSLVLITRDTDFGNILRYPVTPHCGIILLRTHLLSVPEIIVVLKDLIARISAAELTGSLTVVRKGRYRIHRRMFP